VLVLVSVVAVVGRAVAPDGFPLYVHKDNGRPRIGAAAAVVPPSIKGMYEKNKVSGLPLSPPVHLLMILERSVSAAII
jgi:hypothetical protein